MTNKRLVSYILIEDNSSGQLHAAFKQIKQKPMEPHLIRAVSQAARVSLYVIGSDLRRRRYSWNLVSSAGLDWKAPRRAVVIVVLERC